MQKQKFDEIISYFNEKVSEMEIETKYKMELLGMVTALGYVHEKETHDKRTETHACDSISRQAAIDAVEESRRLNHHQDGKAACAHEYEHRHFLKLLRDLPSSQPEITDEQAIEHLQSTGWMQNHDKQMYEMGLKEKLADDSDAYDSLIPSAQPEEVIPHRNYKYLSDYWCACGWHLGKKGDVKYCADCGRKVKWDE